MAAAVRRLIRALGVKVEHDVEGLPVLAGLAREVDAELHRAVLVARADGFTWDYIGRTLGVTKQAAYQRFSP